MTLDSRDRIHLEWLFENKPAFVRSLSAKKLYDLLDRKILQAYRLVEKLKEQRSMTENEAFEIAVDSILAPSDGPATGDNPPEPLPLKEQEEIYRKLENLIDKYEKLEKDGE